MGARMPERVAHFASRRCRNIVATVNLDCRLDLKTIALHARNAEYNPKARHEPRPFPSHSTLTLEFRAKQRFAAVIMRIREPKTTALVFASGKVVVTGAKSEDDSRLASRKYARIIQKLGFEAKFQDFKIQNIVGSVSCLASRRDASSRDSPRARTPRSLTHAFVPQCDIKFPIRLEGLAYGHGVRRSSTLLDQENP